MSADGRKDSGPSRGLERTHSEAERQSSFIKASSLSGDFDSMDRAAWEAAGLDADGSFDDYDLDKDGIITMKEYVERDMNLNRQKMGCKRVVAALVAISLSMIGLHILAIYLVGISAEGEAFKNAIIGIVAGVSHFLFVWMWFSQGQRLVGCITSVLMMIGELIYYLADDSAYSDAAGWVALVALLTLLVPCCKIYIVASTPRAQILGYPAPMLLTRQEAAATLKTGTILMNSRPNCLGTVDNCLVNSAFCHLAIVLRDPPAHILKKATLWMHYAEHYDEEEKEWYGKPDGRNTHAGFGQSSADYNRETGKYQGDYEHNELESNPYFGPEHDIHAIWRLYYEKWLGPAPADGSVPSTAWVWESNGAGMNLTPLPFWLEKFCPSEIQMEHGRNHRGTPYSVANEGSYHNHLCARELFTRHPISQGQMERVWQFVSEVASNPFPAEGLMGLQARMLFACNDRTDRDAFICTELVGETLRMMGVFSEDYSSSNLNPKMFLEKARVTDRACGIFNSFQSLPLKGHAHLGPLIHVDPNIAGVESTSNCADFERAGVTEEIQAKYSKHWTENQDKSAEELDRIASAGQLVPGSKPRVSAAARAAVSQPGTSHSALGVAVEIRIEGAADEEDAAPEQL